MIFEIIVVIFSLLFSVHISCDSKRGNLSTNFTFEIKILVYKPYKRNIDLFYHNELYFVLVIICILNLIFLKYILCRVKDKVKVNF